jgi:hypothetical protein
MLRMSALIILCIVAIYVYFTLKSGENFASNNVRFQPASAYIFYDIGSDTTDITRTYGTVSQRTRFPQFVDLLYGYHSLPPLPKNKSDPNLSTNFKPPPSEIERFSPQSYLADTPVNAKYDPFLDSRVNEGRW